MSLGSELDGCLREALIDDGDLGVGSSKTILHADMEMEDWMDDPI